MLLGGLFGGTSSASPNLRKWILRTRRARPSGELVPPDNGIGGSVRVHPETKIVGSLTCVRPDTV